MFQTFSNHQVVTNGKRNTDCNYLQTDILVGYTSQDASHNQDCCILRLENTYKPSFVTLAGWGVYRTYWILPTFRQPTRKPHLQKVQPCFPPDPNMYDHVAYNDTLTMLNNTRKPAAADALFSATLEVDMFSNEIRFDLDFFVCVRFGSEKS